MFNVYKLTNFAVTLFTWIELHHPISGVTYQNQVGFDKQIVSSMCVCLLSSKVLLQIKNLPKNTYKNKGPENKIYATFNSPCLLTLNALIRFKQPMLVYEEYFNAGVSTWISHITIFTFATKVFKCADDTTFRACGNDLKTLIKRQSTTLYQQSHGSKTTT